MRIFNFVVLPVITAPNNVSTPHISKTLLPIVSLNVTWYPSTRGLEASLATSAP